MLSRASRSVLAPLLALAWVMGCGEPEQAALEPGGAPTPVGFGDAGVGAGGFGGPGFSAPQRSPPNERQGMPQQSPGLASLYEDDQPLVSHTELLDLYANTWHPDWSGSLMLHLEPGHYILDDSSSRSADSRKRGFHLSAYDMARRVPLMVYAPGDPQPGPRQQPASLEHITATLFDLLEVPRPAGVTAPALDFPPVDDPKLIAVVVIDALPWGHWQDYLSQQPGFAQFRANSREFVNTRLSFMSSSTTVSHAVLGTGQPPALTGIPINHTRTDPGHYDEVFIGNEPERLLVPTLADLYDRAQNNQPEVVSFCSQSRAAIAMAGHGRDHPGGDADLVAWQQRHVGPMETNTRAYASVAWMRQEVDPESYLDALSDRSFIQHDLLGLPDLFRSHHNVIVSEQAILAMMDHAGVGDDAVTDLVFLNHKVLDNIAHRWGADVEEYRVSLDELDAWLPRWLEALHARAGDDFLLVVTADHGFGPTLAHPTLASDTRRHERSPFQAELEARFGSPDGPVFEDIQYLNVYLDEARLLAAGHSLEQVCQDVLKRDWVADCLTRGEVLERQALVLP